MSSRHTPCHVSPGEVRVADCADVGVVEHADVPLVAGLVVADEAVLVPDVGGQTSHRVVQQSVLQVKLRPAVSCYNVNVIMTSILYSIPFTQAQQFELSVDLYGGCEAAGGAGGGVPAGVVTRLVHPADVGRVQYCTVHCTVLYCTVLYLTLGS